MNGVDSFKSIFLNINNNVEEDFYKKDFQNKKELLFESILSYIHEKYPVLMIHNEKKSIDFKYEYSYLNRELIFEFKIPYVCDINRFITIEETINDKEIYQYLIMKKEVFSNYELFMIRTLITEELDKLNIKEDINNIHTRIKSTYNDLIKNEENSIHFGKYIPLLKENYKVNPILNFQKHGLYLRIKVNQTFITKRLFYNDFYFLINQDLDIFESLFIQEFNKLKSEYYDLILGMVKYKIKKMNKDKIIEPVYFSNYNDFIHIEEDYHINICNKFKEKRLYANIFINYQEYLRLRKKLYKYRDSYFTLTINKNEPYNIEKKEMSLFITKEEYKYLHKITKFQRRKIKLRR